jgi:hypothetical protein
MVLKKEENVKKKRTRRTENETMGNKGSRKME